MVRYAVVSFDKDKEVSVVPSSWLTEDEKKCWWPPYRDSSKVGRAVKVRSAPQDSWERHSARVLIKCDDYHEARKLCKKAENSSDLQSEAECGRGYRKIKKAKITESSDSDSSGSSSSTGTIDIPRKKLLSPPPALDDVPPLERHNATLERPPRLDGSSASTSSTHLDFVCETPKESKDTKLILRAVARCEASIDEVHGKVNRILHTLREMKKDQPQPSRVDDIAAVNSLIPITSLQEFKSLNDKLESDASFNELLYRRLVRLGGTSVKMSVKYIIDTCLTNEMQTKFNWEGRLGWKTKTNETKTGFKNTKLCSVMTKVLLDNTTFITTEEEISRTMIKYLRNAADRCGGRRRRSADQVGNEAEGSNTA